MKGSSFKGLYLFFCGMCMGACDLIPGISGGTIAFIMGFYTPLLDSLKSFNCDALRLLLKGKWIKFFKKTEFQFLFTLLAGIGLSFVLLANPIQFLLGHPVYRIHLYSAFLGLILASFYFCMKQVHKWSLLKWGGLGLGLITAFMLTHVTISQKSRIKNPYAIKIDIPYATFAVNNYQIDKKLLTDLSAETLSQLLSKNIIQADTLVYDENAKPVGNVSQFAVDFQSSFFNLWLIFCGAVAVCALLLPGISGSYLLTLLGVYPLVIGSLADWISHLKKGGFDVQSFGVLLNLGIGIVVGAVLFSRLLSLLLKSYPGLSLATLSGFMIGALHSVWPFWSYEYALLPLKLEKGLQIIPVKPILPSLLSYEAIFSLFWLIAGFSLFFLIEFLAKHKTISKSF